jgi:hypothetical protein
VIRQVLDANRLKVAEYQTRQKEPREHLSGNHETHRRQSH